MKKIIILLIILLVSIDVEAQKKYLDQSKPFEKVLLAFKTDSILLFKDAFSQTVLNEEDDNVNWKAKLQEGKENFKNMFGDYKLKSFSYVFIEEDMMLIIYYKKLKISGIKVIYENDVWKLDQH